MAFSLSLLRHRLSAARAQSRRAGDAPQGERPAGRLLWAHFGQDVDPRGALLVLDRVVRANGDLAVLTTGRPEDDAPGPVDTPGSAARFLDHWRPDLALFVGTDLFPRLWAEARQRGLPLLAAETRTARHPAPLLREMAGFDAVIAAEPDPRLGPAAEALGRLSTIPAPPPADHRAVERVKESLSARPLWLALDVPAAEIEAVLAAHGAAAHLSHRLVLVLAPAADATAAAWTALERAGHRVASRRRGDMPGPESAVILADDPAEIGIWLRLAPATYLGGTIGGEGPVTSPFIPVSLGSALIHGPRRRWAESALRRLHAAGAACRVDGGAGLAAEVERLLDPEAAADLARAGWTVTSEGAEASARLVDLIEDTLAGIDP